MLNGKAIIFDLYGTLIECNQKSFIKELAACLNISTRVLSHKLFRKYLCCSFASNELFINDLLQTVVAEPFPYDLVDKSLDILERHLACITLNENVKALLGLLKASGYTLGLVSNLAMPFKAPIYKYGLDEYFNAMILSCDTGMLKPEPAIYESICSVLGVEGEQCVFIGDSPINDYQEPIHHGMEALLIKGDLSHVGELVWSHLSPAPIRLIYEGQVIQLEEKNYRLHQFHTLSNEVSGRYNITAKATLERLDQPSERCVVYFKRFALEGSATVEKLAYDICALVGLSTCKAHIVSDTEPLLVTTEIVGDKYDGKNVSDVAYHVGQYSAIAYIFANADFRPRNAIVVQRDGRIGLEMIDMEHYFFDIAIDLTGLENPYNPSTFNSMTPTELVARRKHTVLSPRHGKRARQSFIPEPEFTDSVLNLYKNGWIDMHRKIQIFADQIESLLKAALEKAPYPVIGTRSYRRAMAQVDIDGIMLRMSQDPSEAYKVCV